MRPYCFSRENLIDSWRAARNLNDKRFSNLFISLDRWVVINSIIREVNFLVVKNSSCLYLEITCFTILLATILRPKLEIGMKEKLTQTLAQKLKPGNSRFFVYDTMLPGLLLSVETSGRKTYYVDYTPSSGRRVTCKVGSSDVLTVAQAREAVKEILA